MNTKPDEAPMDAAEKIDLTAQLAKLMTAADRMVTGSLVQTMVMGLNPQSVAAKMLVAGIVAEWTARPHDTLEEIEAETKGVVEAIISSLKTISESPKPAEVYRSYALRQTIGAAFPAKPK